MLIAYPIRLKARMQSKKIRQIGTLCEIAAHTRRHQLNQMREKWFAAYRNVSIS